MVSYFMFQKMFETSWGILRWVTEMCNNICLIKSVALLLFSSHVPFTVSMLKWSSGYVKACKLGYSVHLNYWLSCFVLLFLVVLAIEWFVWSKNHTWLLYLNPTGSKLSVWGLVFIGKNLDCWELFPCLPNMSSLLL